MTAGAMEGEGTGEDLEDLAGVKITRMRPAGLAGLRDTVAAKAVSLDLEEDSVVGSGARPV